MDIINMVILLIFNNVERETLCHEAEIWKSAAMRTYLKQNCLKLSVAILITLKLMYTYYFGKS